MKDPLFEPINIGNMEVKNRIYMPAITLGMTKDFTVTDQIIEFYAERARGGAGMICVGYATVNELAGSPMNIGAHEDVFIPGLKKLSDGIKNNGSRSVVQLNHSGRYNFSFFTGGKQAVAPSAIASNLTREMPKEMTAEDIQQTIADFASAASRVKEAGYDAVEVLSGTGYLISEFLSPLTNKREDEYGGSLENRMRFGLDIVRAIRKSVGSEYPFIIRMNGNDLMEGGQDRFELIDYAQALVENGVDAICVNVGWHEARVPQIVTSVPRGVYAYLAKGIKDAVSVPVIASHRINDPATAREMIADDMCDMVAMGRSLIADPYLPRKAEEGKGTPIVHCVACAQGCFDHLFKLKPVECLCNPKAGYEYLGENAKTENSKNVMVIGGGAAGMSAALSAYERGHNVSLYEKSDKLGGQLYLAGSPIGREEFSEFGKDLEKQVALTSIKTYLNTEVTEELLDKANPDYVILATGAVPMTPPIKGVDSPNVVQAWDVIQDKVYTGKRVVVIGGGAVGVETALHLADKGTLSPEAVKFLLVNKAESFENLYKLATKGSKEITLVEMINKLGKDIGKSTRWVMMQELQKTGVNCYTEAKALEINEDGVKVSIKDKTEFIPADSVVIAAGSKSYNPLKEMLDKKNIAFEMVGDAERVGLAFNAVHAGFKAGKSI